MIAEAVGSLPPTLYQVNAKGFKTPARSHPLYHVLHHEPNVEQTRPVFWETLQAHALIYGNGFAEVERDGGGRPLAVWPIHPSHVRVGRDSDTGKLIYVINYATTGGPPGAPGSQRTLQMEDVLHVPGLSPDGSYGYRLLLVARETMGFALAAQRYGCSLFRNMGRPAGIINSPPNVVHDDEARENLKRSWRQDTGGENVGTVALMEQGYTFNPLTMATNEQTQYKELLEFFVYEVARLLNIQPSKLFDLQKATWGNLTELNRDFLNTTLRPWLEKWEAEMERKLLLPSEKGKYEIEFDTSCLLRTDDATRYAAYAVASGNAAWMTVNEIRQSENLPPIDGGDVLPGSQPEPEDQPEDDQGDDEQDANQGDE
ncbi:Phage portal protein [Fimbriiglobus ruber]|uniref:Phage portal protein n=1 Tax=Fimbriiglobus ruber TaxID=1908690 RepID=A0A225DKB9_9BACT|nr:Phage portal protein [Fimbriiglobus ruber]